MHTSLLNTPSLQLHTHGVENIANSYKILFGISKITSAFVPIVITCFIGITITIILNDIFEDHISNKKVFQIVGFSYIPMLLYYYFFWINLIQYCNTTNIKSKDDFINMKFMFSMQLSDFSLINILCWIYLYIFIICSLRRNDIQITHAIIATLSPSAILLLVSYIIS